MGGFGNTLFQLVAYKHITSNGKRCNILTVLTEKNVVTKILNWKIHDKSYLDVLSKLEITVVKQPHIKTISHLFLAMISKRFSIKILGVSYFKNNSQDLNISRVNIGYFQSKQYLIKNKNHIINIGKILNDLFKKDNVKLKTKIAVHVRLGDSKWAKEHEGYYITVLSILEKSNEPFTVITDSIREARLMFSDFNEVYYESNSTFKDFGLLLDAKTLFIAPSTFSYWAGVANQKYDKLYMPNFLYLKLGFPHENNIQII